MVIKVAKGKNGTVFFCQECGYESAKWMGQCPGCKAWNSMVEERVVSGSKKAGSSARPGQAGEKAEPARLPRYPWRKRIESVRA